MHHHVTATGVCVYYCFQKAVLLWKLAALWGHLAYTDFLHVISGTVAPDVLDTLFM